MKNYGNLYRKLITTSGEIPIGLYRTINENGNKSEKISNLKMDNIHQMILIKMDKLGIDSNKYSTRDENVCLNFVLINPSNDFSLQPGDIVYLLKPGMPVIQSTDLDENEENEENSATSFLINKASSAVAAVASLSMPLVSIKIDSTINEENEYQVNNI